MPVWTDTRYPMPNIPTVHGLTQHAYSQSLDRHDIAQCASPGNVWTIAVDDPRTEWYGGVITAFGQAVWWFIGHSGGPLEMRTTSCWPWEAVDQVRHVIAWNVFREAHLAGQTIPYWTSAARGGQILESSRALDGTEG